MATQRTSSAGGTQSIRKALSLLNQFTAEQPTRTVDELSRLLGAPRSSVYRIVGLLREFELVEQAGDGRYQLGPHAITLGYVARSRIEIADIWRPELERLAAATGESALIMRRVGDAAVCVDRVESDHPVRLSFEVGRAMPLHTGAGAKVLLAFSPADLQEQYVQRVVAPAHQDSLRTELRRIQESGWAESSAEVDPGIWAVAAPAFVDNTARCLSVSVALPDYRFEPGSRDKLRDLTIAAASTLRHKLAHYS